MKRDTLRIEVFNGNKKPIFTCRSNEEGHESQLYIDMPPGLTDYQARQWFASVCDATQGLRSLFRLALGEDDG